MLVLLLLLLQLMLADEKRESVDDTLLSEGEGKAEQAMDDADESRTTAGAIAVYVALDLGVVVVADIAEAAAVTPAATPAAVAVSFYTATAAMVDGGHFGDMASAGG
ncbi:hypothetical protein BGZ58_004310 [Dissophora ornata]|nr:hypothetical protein BGZ58_004310 [Dissophora ornata]